jgi:hypothetical protein
MRLSFFLACLIPFGASAADAPIVIGAGSWPCQMFVLKQGDRFTSVVRPESSPLLCYTMRAMEQYDAIDTDQDELSDIVIKKEKQLVQSGKCQVFAPDVPYTVVSDKYNVLTITREDMPRANLYYRKPKEMAHPCK